MKRKHLKHKTGKFGNSILHINLKFWQCVYCGKLIKDRTPFSVVIINSNPTPYILCSQNCFRIQVLKLEAQRTDKEGTR